MGVVYRAHDALLEREVALKIISASIEGNPELRERFFREARAAGQLSHRNIITIHDLGEHEGQPYLAMEFLTGEDLQKRLSRPEPMSLARKLEIAADICDGLSYAHRRGLIHRDIKPANIFITDEGMVKLLDFGLARMVTSELTASNMMLGTLNYMAPEQVRGERTDHRADIFSFGVVLYEILSGRKAFQGDSFATTLYKILQDVPEPLQQHRRLAALRSRPPGREVHRQNEGRALPGPLGSRARSGPASPASRPVGQRHHGDPGADGFPVSFHASGVVGSAAFERGSASGLGAEAEVRAADARPVGADDPRRRHDDDRSGKPQDDHAIDVVDRRRRLRRSYRRHSDEPVVARPAGVAATGRHLTDAAAGRRTAAGTAAATLRDATGRRPAAGGLP